MRIKKISALNVAKEDTNYITNFQVQRNTVTTWESEKEAEQ